MSFSYSALRGSAKYDNSMGTSYFWFQFKNNADYFIWRAIVGDGNSRVNPRFHPSRVESGIHTEIWINTELSKISMIIPDSTILGWNLHQVALLWSICRAWTFSFYSRILRHWRAAKCENNTEKSKLCIWHTRVKSGINTEISNHGRVKSGINTEISNLYIALSPSGCVAVLHLAERERAAEMSLAMKLAKISSMIASCKHNI